MIKKINLQTAIEVQDCWDTSETVVVEVENNLGICCKWESQYGLSDGSRN